MGPSVMYLPYHPAPNERYGQGIVQNRLTERQTDRQTDRWKERNKQMNKQRQDSFPRIAQC